MRAEVPRPKSFARATAGLLLGLLLVACAPNPATARPEPAAAAATTPASGQGAVSGVPPLIPIRSAQTTVSPSSAPTWMAVDGGFFRDQGLEVELIGVEPGAPFLAALHTGQLDISGSGGPAVVVGNLQGLETVLIGTNISVLEGSIFVRPEIRTLEDLRGRVVGVARLKALTDTVARLAFQRVGLQPDVDVFTRGTGGQAESLAAVEVGTLDGMSVNMPMTLEARKRGYHEIINVSQLRIPFLLGGTTATRRFLSERPDVADRFLRAMVLATSRFKTDRDLAIQVVAKYTKLDDPAVIAAAVDYYAPLFDVDPYPEPAAVQALIDAEENPAARDLRPQELVDYRFAERLRTSGFLDGVPR